MKKFTILFTVLIILTVQVKAQIPNSGFENWATASGHDSLIGWFSGGVTFSTDHFPASVGQYSLKVTNTLPLQDRYSYGYSATFDSNFGCYPSFPVTGHPNQFCGYYKSFPLNNDTIQIGLMLYYQGAWVAGAELTTTNTVSNWTSFSIPISSYTTADSASISVAAFYNDTTCGAPHGPFGNSILYVDNLSFDNLISSSAEVAPADLRYELFPNPAAEVIRLKIENTIHKDLKVDIYNAIGILVRSETLEQNNRQMNVDDLRNGVYMISVSSNGTQGSQRLIIQR